MNILVSASIGSLIAVMLLFNGILSQLIGNYAASIIIHITGFIAVILLLFVKKIKIKLYKGISPFLYSAGFIGVFTVLLNNLSFSKFGASISLAVGLLGQSLASLIIDHFGFLEMKTVPFEKKKFFGLLLIISGVFVMTIF